MTNRLAGETSPYLRQHADNPVDWYPWGEEALSRAKAEHKPILLSIGYAACHWCHVMAHESFEDPRIAAIMNSRFVNIKVDREERPDLDRIYQLAHALLIRRSGGWPLTMFLTPDQDPFYGGTYFPPAPRHGLPGFAELLGQVADTYAAKPEAIASQNEALRTAMADEQARAHPAHPLTSAPLNAARAALATLFDPRYGGFGGAPKFPHPTECEFLLQRSADAGDREALRMVTDSLRHMAEGGLFDQLGGGFCRYSVDQQWSIPHFEKMLYDNGLLLALYADACLAAPEAPFVAAVEGTAAWLAREMQSPEGGFYCSLDADSDHEEGKYYVWTREEVSAQLSPDEYAVLAPHYGLDGPPNFEGQSWHLRVVRPLASIAADLRVSLDQARSLLESGRARLLDRRSERSRPGLDDKILTSWNALAIIGLARSARAMGVSSWADSARRAFDFLRNVMWRDGRLLASYNAGQARLNAYLDDYAYTLAAALEMLQLEFREPDLRFAIEVAESMLTRFEDRVAGGFYFTSHDHESLIFRPKSGQDDATPNANGVGARSLARLGYLVGDTRYTDAAERALQAFRPGMEAYPNGHCSLLGALTEWLDPPAIVLLRGRGQECEEWRDRLARRYRPHLLVLEPGEAPNLPAAMAKPAAPVTAAYVCRAMTCLAPIQSLDELERLLEGTGRSPGAARPLP